jgi:hypothetical protein
VAVRPSLERREFLKVAASAPFALAPVLGTNEKFAQRRALLTRISELLVNPSAVPLLDHYVDRLVALEGRG